MARIAYVNGDYVPLDEAKISILDRGFIFADSIYEVTAVIESGLIDSDLHMARLERSLGEIGMPMPVPASEIVAIERVLMEKNGLTDGMIYLQVTRGAAERDFPFPAKDTPQSLVMFTVEKDLANDPVAETGIRVKSVPDLRWTRRDIKSTALLAQVLAKQAARAEGCGEAWMLEGDTVTEGGSSTAYIVTGDKRLITRPLSQKVLPGCTRAALLALVAEGGATLEERPFTLDEAKQASEAFITGAGALVMPVVGIDDVTLGDGKPGPVTKRLRELYIEQARRQAAEQAGR